MAKVQVNNVVVLDNPSPFYNPFQFEITFECIEDLSEGECGAADGGVPGPGLAAAAGAAPEGNLKLMDGGGPGAGGVRGAGRPPPPLNLPGTCAAAEEPCCQLCLAAATRETRTRARGAGRGPAARPAARTASAAPTGGKGEAPASWRRSHVTRAEPGRRPAAPARRLLPPRREPGLGGRRGAAPGHAAAWGGAGAGSGCPAPAMPGFSARPDPREPFSQRPKPLRKEDRAEL